MKKIAVALGACVAMIGMLSGCASADEQPSQTIPPESPTHKIAGSTLPASVAGYTVLGAEPVAGQVSATYAANSSPLDLAVVTFDDTGVAGDESTHRAEMVRRDSLRVCVGVVM